jgi:GT2 family glycosyltransferase
MPDPARLDLSIIIVSWNVRELLRGCLSSLHACPELQLIPGADAPARSGDALTAEILVVDNASADGSADMVAGSFPDVRLICNRENRGFTGGNNQGLALARGDCVLLLNPDTITPPGALRSMVRALHALPGTAVLGPELRYADGSLQSSRRRFPTLAMAMAESTPLSWHLPERLNRWSRAYHMDDIPLPAAGSTQPVDWLVGAALLMRRDALAQVGGFDVGYFMYSEEMDWCRRAADAGWQRVFLAGVSITHYEGKSSEQVVAERHIRFQTSKVRYFRKFHGALAAEALRAFLLASFALEWLIDGGKWLAGHRRSLRAQRLSAYAELLRSRLSDRRTAITPRLWGDGTPEANPPAGETG